MSYPRTVQVLIIEDDQGAKAHYAKVLDAVLPKKGLLVDPPQYAFCLEDGHRHLASDRIFHLVILDLQLPEMAGQPAPESIEFGRALLKACIERDNCPIPCLLVISGHLNKAKQSELEKSVREGFAYGRVLVKGPDLDDEIATAVQEAHRYCDVGVHLRDAGTRVFPTLSPREEYLLRLATLRDEQTSGLDLEWWSAQNDRGGSWTKTLIGRFILDKARGFSLHSFFKFGESRWAETMFGDAQAMEQKLKHIKVQRQLLAGSRSLLITQAATSGGGAPRSLSDVLAMPTHQAAALLAGIAVDVADQVKRLGDTSPDERPAAELIWSHHDRANLEAQWQRRADNDTLAAANPIDLFDRLRASRYVVRHDRQSMLHGDLNFTNIAVEFVSEKPLAFIFDGEGCAAGVNVADLATLEVTLLLQQDAEGREPEIVGHCKSLFGLPAEPAGADLSRAENTRLLVHAIREEALKVASLETYALMVFDKALIQLGGLGYQSTGNKIRSHADAARVAGFSAAWLLAVAPQLADARK
jgi:CheY-like chemotaxis protein